MRSLLLIFLFFYFIYSLYHYLIQLHSINKIFTISETSSEDFALSISLTSCALKRPAPLLGSIISKSSFILPLSCEFNQKIKTKKREAKNKKQRTKNKIQKPARGTLRRCDGSSMRPPTRPARSRRNSACFEKQAQSKKIELFRNVLN